MHLLNEIGGFKWKGAFKKTKKATLIFIYLFIYYILHLNVKQWFKLIFKDK